MKWFYQDEGREVGPLSETTLQELHAGGAITDETPVRREDSLEWQLCAIAFSQTVHPEQQQKPVSKNPPFKFECPHCQQHISTEEDYSGTKVQCPSCGSGFIVPPLTGGKSIKARDHEIIKPKTIGKKGKTRTLIKWVGACVVICFCIALAGHSFIRRTKDYLNGNDPLYSTYKSATRLDCKPFLGAGHNAIYRREINNKFLYFGWNSDKPFTGWVKQTTDDAPARFLWSFKNGRLEKEFSWYDNGKAHQEITYDINKADNVGGGDGDSVAPVGRSTGIISIRQWTYDGKPCLGTEVVNGNGKAIAYNYEGGKMGVVFYDNGVENPVEEDNSPLDPTSQLILGGNYYTGEGGKVKDLEEAAKWFHKSAEQGDSYAEYLLGICYWNGQGVDRDYSEAAKWFEKSASQEFPDAQLMLGKSYILGKGVKQDDKLAYMWVNLASNSKNEVIKEEARRFRAEMERKMESDVVSEAQKMSRAWKTKKGQ